MSTPDVIVEEVRRKLNGARVTVRNGKPGHYAVLVVYDFYEHTAADRQHRVYAALDKLPLETLACIEHIECRLPTEVA